MTNRLADRAAAAVGRHTSRRGFLAKVGLAGTALAAGPVNYLLRPDPAYAAICRCKGKSCDCASLCCDGYTEFCCTITGTNTCPPGTALGGWWKAAGSGYCGGPRYYLDCNTVPQGGYECMCECGDNDCNNRGVCCSSFRYGQCHQEIAVMGPIACRVVTCTPPWELDPTCTTTPATDQATRFHDRACLHSRNEEEDDMPPAPAICYDTAGVRWVFVRGTDRALWAKKGDAGYVKLGGILTSGPNAVALTLGRIEVVVRGADGSHYMIAYDGSVWGPWTDLGGRS